MRTAPEVFSDCVAAITARLAARHDRLSVLDAVITAYGDLLAPAVSGTLIADPRGGYALLSASDDRVRFIELPQIQFDQGPCLDSITGNTLVDSLDLEADRVRWPRFAKAAANEGIRSAYAFPLSLDGRAVGGINLFFTRRTELVGWQLRLGQSLANLATLGLTQERDPRRVERLAEQTMTALNDRVHIGQAIGVLAGDLGLTPEVARHWLYEYSSRTGRSPRELAQALTDGSLAPADLVAQDG
ncbi:GAF and ANTAR domain-containing protein [Kutzneria albida]|uniref:GAF and ANTAR domain-containing protein n=1 Tax=Kutzneria albida TaxID=43357 RepID=UPI001F2BDF87|nr:GAF and ANTAR domain-containing protein [Kutzneria albida]